MPDGTPLIDPDVVASRISALLQERRRGAVRPLLAALEKLAPQHPDLALLRAAYYCQMEEIAQALSVLDDAIAIKPADPALHLRRAEILFSRGAFAGAAENAADAVLLAPGLNRGKSILGLALLGLKKFDQALPCLAESFSADPANVDVALALAVLDPAGAIEILSRAIAAKPRVALLRNALTRRYLAADTMAQALHHAEQTRADGLADAETCCLLAFAQMQEACWAEAGDCAARALSLAPEHHWASRLSAALGRRTAGSLGQVGSLSQAGGEDAGLAEQALFAGGTIAPAAFCALLEESQKTGPVLDLYCGTGLNAIAAHALPLGPWTGVEPDPGLRTLCAERGLYARLEAGDPLAFLGDAKASIILLNEALAYVESPKLWFSALRAGLAPGGIALAAIPTGNDRLTGHALFGHSVERIAQQAMQAGLAISVKRPGILRHIEGIPMQGAIVSLQAC